MATSIGDIRNYCGALGLEVVESGSDHVLVILACDSFQDATNQRRVQIRIQILEGGRMVSIGAHGVVTLPNDPVAAVRAAQLMLRFCHVTRAIQAEFDDVGRLSFVVEHPVEDSTFSLLQLKTYLVSLVAFVDGCGKCLTNIEMRDGQPVLRNPQVVVPGALRSYSPSSQSTTASTWWQKMFFGGSKGPKG